MLPTIERRPRRSMYASESLPPSTIATRTSWGSAVIRIRLVWLMEFSPAQDARPRERGCGGTRRQVGGGARARVAARTAREHAARLRRHLATEAARARGGR